MRDYACVLDGVSDPREKSCVITSGMSSNGLNHHEASVPFRHISQKMSGQSTWF